MSTPATIAAYRLVLLRHGESVWNEQGLFTGWVDVGLSERGVFEAARAGELLAASDMLPDVVHTSLLARAIRTTELALEAADRQWIAVRRSWRLNERHYGALQGKSQGADPARVRRRAVQALASLIRRSAAPARNRLRGHCHARPTLCGSRARRLARV